MAMASDAIADTAFRSHGYSTGLAGTSSRSSGCLAVRADESVCCGATAIAKLAVVLYCCE